MPFVFFRCDTCRRKETLWEEGSVMDNEACPGVGCGGTLKWYRVIYGDPPSRNAQPFEPVLLFRDPAAPEGQYRTPGWNDEPTPAGFERVEIRNIREWDAVTKQMSAHGRRVAEEAHHEKQQAVDKVHSERLAELRTQMRHWNGAAREFAEAAIARSETRERRKAPSGEVIAHALEYDSSNREAWRDERTGWRGRRS